MEYSVEELAQRSGVPVDTIRFYQGRGLIPPPARRGRRAVYGEVHRERLERIRAWQREGLSLAVIKRLLAAESAEAPLATGDRELLRALADARLGGRTLSRAELAAEAGVPEPLVRAVEAAGLVEPVEMDGEERFTESDLEMARAGLAILSAGFPLDALLGLAVEHAQSVQQVCDRAIALFDQHVRQSGTDPEAVAEAFRVLLPQVTRLVALHFQRTLVKRALERLSHGGDAEALRAALDAVNAGRLEVAWR